VNGVTTLSSSEESTQKRLERALAHPVRARALAILEAEVASPKQIADELGAPLGVVAYHVRVLASLNLIRLVEVIGRRGSLEHRYGAVQRPGDEGP
jgi:DNA-binding transcriptional ArsR family regulator